MIICDIGGTVANLSHRLKYITGKQKDWDTFHKMCYLDTPIVSVTGVVQSLIHYGHVVTFITGRPESTREATQQWLNIYVTTNYELYMRGDNDHRHDSIIKQEIYEKEIKDYHRVLCVFEDRQQVVDMWRSLGLTCFQVAGGNY